jgi:putative MATE family efflux protein
MRFKTPTREEILSGPPIRTMARIGAPAVVSTFLFTLYNLVDAFWVGRLPSEESAAVFAGIQVSWPIVWFLIAFVSGFGGAAASALISQYTGAKRPLEANVALNQLVSLSTIAAVVLGLAGYALSPWLLALLVGQGSVADAASLYIGIVFLGLPTMVLPGLFTSAFSAVGDTVTPLLVNGAGVLLNMLLDPPFVLGWGPIPRMGIAGAAYATVISQGLATILFFLLLLRRRGVLHLQARALRLRWAWVVKGLRIGVPAALAQSSMAFGFVIMTKVISRLPNPEVTLAGYGVGDRVLGMAFIFTDGLGTGLTTMVGQALGADRMERARELLRKGLWALVGILSVEAVILWAVRYPAIALFIPGRPDVADVGGRLIASFAASLPFLGTFFTALSIYRASGHNVPAMVLGFLRLWCLRIPLALLLGFVLKLGADGVWWGMSASNFVAGLIALGFLANRSWQSRVVEPLPEEGEALAVAPKTADVG